ncbi:hypothetical protein C7C46_24345 [Streptomyces tateyamensis]|uniref:Putative restriction endonuclease domain-containing protein n=1 Tax=Streptomyces tateyamensis TaxID=565073 RepID=A0A2V4N840_9ACTN|nr:Uma2 family endonuclease [Streptomyces tateyamensis]PYC73951.1 hypothetical protein C7C46_24345 [Streptomyces tateyamensis]
MTAMTHERPVETEWSEEQVLLDWFLELVTPEGFRAELINGEITVSPPPDGDHENIISKVIRQVIRESLVEMDVSGGKGLVLPRGSRSPKNHVIPDLTFVPEELDCFSGAPSWMDPAGVALVVEVTSSKPAQDRVAKRHAYASAAIPLYLLVDRELSQVTLFSAPGGEDYTESHVVALGKSLPLPDPFGFELDTSDFL